MFHGYRFDGILKNIRSIRVIVNNTKKEAINDRSL